MSKYDVFMSYSNPDKPVVLEIANELKRRGLEVWLDEWELIPGRPWVPKMEQALEDSGTIAWCVGPNGTGAWAERELLSTLDAHVLEGKPVIPVRLPGTPKDLKLRPVLRQNTWVEFERGSDAKALERLIWGIRGTKEPATEPVQTSPAPAPARSEVDEAVELLVGHLESGNVTYYLGGGVTAGAIKFPRRCDVARQLVADLELDGEGPVNLLPSLDVAGQYYAFRHTVPRLERKLEDLLAGAGGEPPETLRHLAETFKLLARRPPRRRRRQSPQLVVTTNLDVIIERTLLQAGISFSRIVQHRSGRRLDVNEYREVSLAADGSIRMTDLDGSVRNVPSNDIDALDDAILTVGYSKLEGRKPLDASIFTPGKPLLYKFAGSLDIEHSCIISSDHYFDALRRMQSDALVPPQITEIIADSPALFMGYSLLDPDYRLLYHAILREAFQVNPEQQLLRYALLNRPATQDGIDDYQRIEARLWSGAKMIAPQQQIAIIETSPNTFLQTLNTRISNLVGVG